jgi:DNA repair ATPase RecN
MKNIFSVFIVLVLFSCKQESESQQSDNNVDSLSFQQKVQIDDRQYALEPEAREYALSWVEFITAQNEIRNLENATLKQIMRNSSSTAQIMESLTTSLPDSLRSVSVEARLNVINTKAQLLKQYSKKRNPDVNKIRQTTQELYSEFNNLKLQMNELFLKTLEDFEGELDRFEEMEREMDSLNASQSSQKDVS